MHPKYGYDRHFMFLKNVQQSVLSVKYDIEILWDISMIGYIQLPVKHIDTGFCFE